MTDQKHHWDVLVDFALGELNRESRKETLFHLAECRECREELARVYRLVDAAAMSEEPRLSDEFFDSLRQEIEENVPVSEPPRTLLELALQRLAMTGVPSYVMGARLLQTCLTLARLSSTRLLPATR